MKKLLLVTGALIGTTLSLNLSTVSSAQATDFTFNGNFTGGYSATGSFTTKNNTPPSFSEVTPGPNSAPFPTQFLQSLSLSVFQASTLIDSGSGVVNGISNDNFLRLTYDNAQTPNLPELDVSTQSPGETFYYFISNNLDPDGQPVPFGSTTYNLFSFDIPTTTTTFLGSTSSIQATVVPESSSVLGLLALAAFGTGSAFKSKLK